MSPQAEIRDEGLAVGQGTAVRWDRSTEGYHTGSWECKADQSWWAKPRTGERREQA